MGFKIMRGSMLPRREDCKEGTSYDTQEGTGEFGAVSLRLVVRWEGGGFLELINEKELSVWW